VIRSPDELRKRVVDTAAALSPKSPRLLMLGGSSTRLLLAPISQVKNFAPSTSTDPSLLPFCPRQVYSFVVVVHSVVLSPSSCHPQQEHECGSGPIEACPPCRVSVHVLTASPLCLPPPPDHSLHTPATVSITPSPSSSSIPTVGSKL